MRFTSEDKLHGPLFVVNQAQQSLWIGQYQIPAFVTSHTSREANRQCRGIKHRLSRFDVIGTVSGSDSCLNRSMPDKRNQAFFQPQVRVPQFFVRYASDSFSPDVGMAQRLLPLVADMLLDQKTQQR